MRTAQTARTEQASANLETAKQSAGAIHDSLGPLAAEQLEDRRARSKFFETDIIFDSGWDMLIDLFICSIQGTAPSVTTISQRNNIPTTTAIRWLNTFQERGYITRTQCNFDKRVQLLSLSNLMRRKMDRYFSGVAKRRRWHEKSAS